MSHASFESICYKRNYLKQVIVRFDLLNPIPEIEKKLPPKIGEAAMKAFPVAEPKKVREKAYHMDLSKKGSLTETERNKIVWQFHGKNRDKTLVIATDAILITYSAYRLFDELKTDFMGILSSLFDVYKDLQGRRLGLRYINDIDLPQDNKSPLYWNEYLNEGMLCLFRFSRIDDIEAISRVFHNLEYNFSDFNLRYQFGMNNPDYPAPIKKKSFVLDLDAYYDGPQNKDDVVSNLDKYHDKIQEIFEHSIIPKLREVMNAG
ncbi:MAG: TIGR04255 family protein [Dissulfurispiraceae bacterium]